MYPSMPQVLAEQIDGHFVVEIGHHAQVRDLAHPAEHKGKPADPETQHADGVNHDIHAHGMHGVLGPGKARLHQREAQLHEHDQVAGDQGPDNVNGDLVVAHRVRDFRQDGFPRFLGSDILDRPGNRTARIVVGAAAAAGCSGCRRRPAAADRQ